MDDVFYEDFIYVEDNFLNEEECKEILNFYKQCDDAGITFTRQSIDPGLSTMLQEDKSVTFPHTTHDKDLSVNLDVDWFGNFTNKFFSTSFYKYKNYNNILNNFGELQIMGGKVQKTEPSQGYHQWHCETQDFLTSSRVLTFTVYLNDDFDYGETEFLNHSIRVKPKTGSLCIFPCGFTHVHRGNPPANGTKYILTGWALHR